MFTSIRNRWMDECRNLIHNHPNSQFTHSANACAPTLFQAQGQSPGIMGRKRHGPCTQAQSLAMYQKGEWTKRSWHVHHTEPEDSYSVTEEKSHFRYVYEFFKIFRTRTVTSQKSLLEWSHCCLLRSQKFPRSGSTWLRDFLWWPSFLQKIWRSWMALRSLYSIRYLVL